MDSTAEVLGPTRARLTLTVPWPEQPPDVRRSKALALILRRVRLTDRDGNPLHLIDTGEGSSPGGAPLS